MQKKFFEILVKTALTVGLFWTILKLTPKSALLSFTILQTKGLNWQCCLAGGYCGTFTLARTTEYSSMLRLCCSKFFLLFRFNPHPLSHLFFQNETHVLRPQCRLKYDCVVSQHYSKRGNDPLVSSCFSLLSNHYKVAGSRQTMQ